MMKTRIFLNLSLLALLVASCGPSAAPAEAPAQPAAPVVEPATPVPNVVVEPPAAATLESAPTESPAPLAAATSRGDNLEATDPRTVNLASGGLQLVEFFRFT